MMCRRCAPGRTDHSQGRRRRRSTQVVALLRRQSLPPSFANLNLSGAIGTPAYNLLLDLMRCQAKHPNQSAVARGDGQDCKKAEKGYSKCHSAIRGLGTIPAGRIARMNLSSCSNASIQMSTFDLLGVCWASGSTRSAIIVIYQDIRGLKHIEVGNGMRLRN